jgi:hypothetical protein
MRLDAAVVPATYRFVLELDNDEFTSFFDDLSHYLELMEGEEVGETFSKVYEQLAGVE